MKSGTVSLNGDDAEVAVRFCTANVAGPIPVISTGFTALLTVNLEPRIATWVQVKVLG